MKGIGGEPGDDKGSDVSRRAGNGDYLDPVLDGPLYQSESGVGDPWGAGIGDQSYIMPFNEPRDEAILFGLLIVLEETGQGGLHPIAHEQPPRPSCILSRNEIHAAQDLDGTEGDILQVPYGGGDQVESSPLLCHRGYPSSPLLSSHRASISARVAS